MAHREEVTDSEADKYDPTSGSKPTQSHCKMYGRRWNGGTLELKSAGSIVRAPLQQRPAPSQPLSQQPTNNPSQLYHQSRRAQHQTADWQTSINFPSAIILRNNPKPRTKVDFTSPKNTTGKMIAQTSRMKITNNKTRKIPALFPTSKTGPGTTFVREVLTIVLGPRRTSLHSQ